MKNKICVIFTGGTISCKTKKNRLCPNKESANELLNLFNKKNNVKTQFDLLYPINILSENLVEKHLKLLFESIKSVKEDDYDGIIVAHGTDNLHFTANLIAFTYDKKIPLVFVSSLYPLTHEKSNALDNFSTAIKFINEEKNGVFVSFKNSGEACKIHLASKIQEIDYNGNLFSFIDKEYATNVNDEFVYNYTLNKVKPLNFKIDNNVLVINSHSLRDFSLFELNSKVKAIILKTYHSGTFCSYGETTNALRFAKELKKKNIPLIISPVIKTDCVYESFCMGENIIFSYNQSLEACLVKTMLALGNGLDIEEVLSTELNNEFIKSNY